MTKNAERYLRLLYKSRTMKSSDRELDTLLGDMDDLWVSMTEDECFEVERQLDFEDEEVKP